MQGKFAPSPPSDPAWWETCLGIEKGLGQAGGKQQGQTKQREKLMLAMWERWQAEGVGSWRGKIVSSRTRLSRQMAIQDA